MDAEQVERLASFDGRGACVLSAYLGLGPERQVDRTYRTVFKDLAKEARARFDEPRRTALNAEIAKVADWLETNPPPGLGLAIFSCMPAGLWETLSFHVPLRDRLVFESPPYVEPLLELLDEYEPYAVALVTRRRRGSSVSFSARSRRPTTSKTSCPASTIRVACRRQTFSATMRRTSSGT